MPDQRGRPYVYLAGPDVFYPDAPTRARRMKRALARRQMVGLFPMDNKFDPSEFADATGLGLAIGNANEAMMRKADIIIANIQPWRGVEADDGTAYEVGYMAAQNKIIVLHTNDMRSFAERVINDIYKGRVHRDGPFLRGDHDKMMVEDFTDFADNLMLINAGVNSMLAALGESVDPRTVVQRSFRDAARVAERLWAARSRANNKH